MPRDMAVPEGSRRAWGDTFMKAGRVLYYPGSKWNVAGELAGMIPPHHSYVEPYFGSGAVLFNKPPSDIETVNDLDSEVVNLFRCIQQDPERLARLVMTTPYSREVYSEQYDTGKSPYMSTFQRAAGFLVRCWQGHGFRTAGGKSGWKNDVAGRERAYALWNWYRLPEWIISIAERLRTVQIECRPALEVIRHFDRSGVFMYLDPPYLFNTRGSMRRIYSHEMTDGDHEELLDTVLESRAMIMISGYGSELYSSRLKGWTERTMRSCAEGGKPRTETVWMNYDPPGQMDVYDFLREGAQ